MTLSSLNILIRIIVLRMIYLKLTLCRFSDNTYFLITYYIHVKEKLDTLEIGAKTVTTILKMSIIILCIEFGDYAIALKIGIFCIVH